VKRVVHQAPTTPFDDQPEAERATDLSRLRG
jgi:hypothetical protein